MSQHDFDIANQSASSARSDINSALKALASLSSGATAPSTTYANMPWYDTSTNTLKVRAEADDAWISIGYLDQSTDTFALFDDTKVVNSGGTQTGLLGDQAESVWQTGTGTTESLVSPAKIKAAIEALVSTGWRRVETKNPTSDSSTMTFTGLSSYKSLRLSFMLQTDASATLYMEIRESGGTWRQVGAVFDSVGVNSAVGAEFTLDNFNDTAGTNMVIVNGQFQNIGTSIDRSDDSRWSTPSATRDLSVGYSSYNESYDELRIRSSSGNILGTGATTRAFAVLDGLV